MVGEHTGQTFSVVDIYGELRRVDFDGFGPFCSAKRIAESTAREKPDNKQKTNPLVAMGGGLYE